MSIGAIFDILAAVLDVGGEKLVASGIAQGETTAELVEFMGQQFPGITPAVQQQVLDFATDMVAAAGNISRLSPNESVLDADIPTNELLLENQDGGRRAMVEVEFTDPETLSSHLVRIWLTDLMDQKELYEELYDSFADLIQRYFEDFDLNQAYSPEELGVKLNWIEKGF